MSLQNYTFNNFQNKKPQKIGIAGYYFLSVIQYDENYSNTVTKNPIEDGSVVSDHIIIEPEVIQIQGNVGQENIFLSNINTELNKLIEPLERLNNYGGTYTQQQLSVINADLDSGKNNLDYINSKINDGTYFANEFGIKKSDDSDDINKEVNNFYLFINGIKQSKQLVPVETPNGIFENMAITSIALTNVNNSPLAFNISLEKFNKVETIFTEIQKKTKNPSINLDGQANSQVSVGTQDGKNVPANSNLFNLVNSVTGVYKAQ